MSGFEISTDRRSPLGAQSLPDGLAELPFLSQIDLQLDPDDASAVAAAGTAIGAVLPIVPNTVSSTGELSVLWLGPTEWLIVAPAGQEERIETALRNALSSGSSSVVDVSANRTTLELRGPRARDILESGCPVDLESPAFDAGRCAQTLVGRAGVILWQTEPAPSPTYRLLVRPSFAAYLAAWLSDA